MVPIYAINAWFALKFPVSAIYLDSARECYEAYVIYNFMSYLLNYLRMDHPDLESYLMTKPQIGHLPPICCLPQWRMGRELVERCKHGVMQYTVVRPLTTCIAFACAMAGDEYYGEGEFNFRSAWSYLIIINNISQIFAMYCLLLFYKATKAELSPIKPVAKFMCVKAVVFLSFWQSILIAILFNTGAIKLHDLNAAKGASVIQDLCICIEMFLAAVAHYFSFSYRPFVDLAAEPQNCFASFKSMWDFSDVQKDVVEHIKHVGHTASGVLSSPLQVGKAIRIVETEMTPLLSGDETNLASTPEVASEAEASAYLSQTQPVKNGMSANPANSTSKMASTVPESPDHQSTPLMQFTAKGGAVTSASENNQTICVAVEVHKAAGDGNKLISWDEFINHQT